MAAPLFAASPEAASQALIARLLPGEADRFVVEMIPAPQGRDVFEIESRAEKVVLRGNNGVSVASALNWYLRHYCRSQISLWGRNVRLPRVLPAVAPKVRQVSGFANRYFLNFCAFSYSLAWWNWDRWEELIDWMALHGVNMPLAVTGQEAIWEKVYRDLGLSDEQIGKFFVGPGYLPFGWMGCMDGWGGPLARSWIDRHLELEKRILARERELGMRPVLQGFTGHVPAAVREVFPKTQLKQLPSWAGFPPTYFVEPGDPLFRRIGTMFIAEQTRQFGTDHLYASDTFIEMQPPSNDPAFLAAMGRSVYGAMSAADPQAVWVMQGWIFLDKPKFWQPPQAKALFGAVPDERMILLDLACENAPVWSRTEAFYGKPWMWNVIQDYGDVVSLHAGMPQIAANLREAMTSPRRGSLVGIGMVNEGLGNNPVVNDFLGEMAWRGEVPDLKEWVKLYMESRYGSSHASLAAAWETLLRTAYRCPGTHFAPVIRRPTLSENIRRQPPYEAAELARAWGQMLEGAGEAGSAQTYRFDLVQVARQSMADLSVRILNDAVHAYQSKDRRAFHAAAARFLQLIRDMDELTGTRQEFLLGRWIADARAWGTNDAERNLNEWNARNILTLWGPKDSSLKDYANRQWSGLLAGFYLPRWKMFFDRLDASLAKGLPFDEQQFEQDVRTWEEQWTHRTNPYPAAPRGDSLAVAKKMWSRYRPRP